MVFPRYVRPLGLGAAILSGGYRATYKQKEGLHTIQGSLQFLGLLTPIMQQQKYLVSENTVAEELAMFSTLYGTVSNMIKGTRTTTIATENSG